MNLPVSANQEMTISSYELWRKLNSFRQEDDQKPVRHDDFLRRVIDECDDLPQCEIFAVPNSNAKIDTYQLNQDQMLLVGMRESKKVRRKVLKWIKELSESKLKIPTNFAEALQLAADQAKQLELQAPKVAFVDNLVDRTGLMNATQVAQKHGLSAVKLNKVLDELKVYNKAIKRGRAFQQWFVDKGHGEMKKTDLGFSQAMFTNAGEIWINEQLISEGVI